MRAAAQGKMTESQTTKQKAAQAHEQPAKADKPVDPEKKDAAEKKEPHKAEPKSDAVR